MAASGQRVWRGGAAPVAEAANHAAGEAATPPAGSAIPEFQLKAPWHVRNAHRLYWMIGLACAAGLAAAGYHAWWLFFNPLDRALAVPVKVLPIRAAEPAADPAPVAKARPPATVKPAAAPPQRAKAPVDSTRPAPRRAAVTHTLAEQARAAAQPVPAEPRADSSRCSEGVVALGLCGAAGAKEAR